VEDFILKCKLFAIKLK